jgi:Tfp pilus assembly protein PilE
MICKNDGSQLGRSMIEMLGVLAVVGVLSVGAFAGYSKAMEKHKANEAIATVEEVVMAVEDVYINRSNYMGLSISSLRKSGALPDHMFVTEEELMERLGGEAVP